MNRYRQGGLVKRPLSSDQLGKIMFKCPFCGSKIYLVNSFEFSCPMCRQLVGVVLDGPFPRLFQAAPDTRKPWVAPVLRADK